MVLQNRRASENNPESRLQKLIETLGSPLSRSACWCLQAENLPGWGPTTHPGWTLAHNVLRTPGREGIFVLEKERVTSALHLAELLGRITEQGSEPS